MKETISLAFLQKRIAELENQTPPIRLKGGPGDGTFDGMEARVANLEKRFDRVEGKIDGLSDKVTDMRVEMSALKERVAHLPSKEFIYKGIAGLIAVMSALAVLAPKIQQAFGIIPK